MEREGWDAGQKRMEDQETKVEPCEQCWVKTEKEKEETDVGFTIKQRTHSILINSSQSIRLYLCSLSQRLVHFLHWCSKIVKRTENDIEIILWSQLQRRVYTYCLD